MQRKKPAPALEKIAREICDSDEFVQHVANIGALYRREHALESGPRRTAVRQSLRAFEGHAASLGAWLKSAQGGSYRPERDALDSIGKKLRGAPPETAIVATWLGSTAAAATQAIADMKAGKRNADRTAPRVTAEALRATFEHHKLKWTTSIARGQPSPAVRLLCAIARNAGDASLVPADARKAMRPTAK